MMATIPNLLVASFIIFSLFHGNAYSNTHDANNEKNVFIVYIGAKPHDDHDLIAKSHHDILTNVLGSEEEAKKSIVYNYKYSFSGFAAELTKSQAKRIAEIPGVIKVIEDTHHNMPLNTRSWDYLDLSVHTPNNLLQKSNLGDGIIIGVIDSGIYPSRAFNDKDHGPIPSKWKGICKSEGKFNATEMCNKKIIGARWFREGFAKQYQNITFLGDASPLDDSTPGHGTHVASTAAGSFVDNVTYYDINVGTFRGGAPHAKLAIYKACWAATQNMDGQKVESCAGSDILSAFDQAIQDGVDLLSVSIASTGSLLPEMHESNANAIGSFHALVKGIPVVFGAGNDGPNAMTVLNVAPWAITVAASSIDRSFSILVTLGNNKTIVGEGVFAGKEIDFTSYDVIFKPKFQEGVDTAENMIPDNGSLKGKVVVVITDKVHLFPDLINRTASVGGIALIMALRPHDMFVGSYNERTANKKSKVPLITISYADGNVLLDWYMKNEDRATLKVSTTRIHLGKPTQTKVAHFSSRGPNPKVPAILKPDISAPGVHILAASNGGAAGELTLMSGTSMATPHVSGIIALLKKAHPDWSPSALKSAISTTAWNYDSHGFSVFAEGSSPQLANPFDCGGGIINPNAANQPGLVYDMEAKDYVHYFCALGYKNEEIYNMTRFGEFGANNGFNAGNICPHKKLSILNVLNVPSITVPDLRKSISIIRTVTNVGPVNSTYKAIIQAPIGTNITVKPKVLKFSSTRKKITFITKISSTQESMFYMFGSLAWTDGKHYVRIPISVKTDISP